MKLINTEVRIETTNQCQLSCIMCPHDTMTREKVTMGYDHFADLVVQAYEMGAEWISPFGFGEPLFDSDIINKIQFCTRMGLKTFLTTNAGLLNTNMAYGLLEAGLTRLRVSAHGIYGRYEKVHRGLSFVTFTRNVFNFIKVNDVRFDHSCRVDVTIIPQNGEHINDLLWFWKDKVDDIEIWSAHGWGGKQQYRKETEKKRKTCGRPFRGPIQIQADGKVIPCCFLTDGEIILGDTYVEPLEDIVKGDRFNELRRKHESGDLEGLACESCDQLYIGESPLLYSTISNGINQTSSIKFNLLEN